MRILELCLSPDRGGLELNVVHCVAALRDGDEVIAMLGVASAIRAGIEPLGVRVETFRLSLRALPLIAAWRLARFIDREAIDAVHIHWGDDFPLAALAKRFSRRKPRLVYTRQMVITRPKRDRYHRLLYGQLDAMLAITGSLATQAKTFLPEADAHKVECLYYGVNALDHVLTGEERRELRSGWGCKEGDFLIAIIGRLEAFKGQHLVVEALAGLRGQGLPVRLLIVGHAMNEEYPRQLREQVRSLGLEGYVSFEGFTDEPQRWMQACDTVVLATIEETFGLVLVEAMRAGVAVIGSDRGGVPEIIDHGENGLLFKSGSSASLGEQLARYLRDDRFRGRMAMAGRQSADRRFEPSAHFRRLREVLAGS